MRSLQLDSTVLASIAVCASLAGASESMALGSEWNAMPDARPNVVRALLDPFAQPLDDDWSQSEAPWTWLEGGTSSINRRGGLEWSAERPFAVAIWHGTTVGWNVVAHAGFAPQRDAWATMLEGGTRNEISDGTSALFGTEASLAVVTELGPRGAPPWSLALGGGWSGFDREFMNELDGDPSEDSMTLFGFSEGQAVVWLRLSREF